MRGLLTKNLLSLKNPLRLQKMAADQLCETRSLEEDISYMTVSERLDRLINGYFRLNYNKSSKKNEIKLEYIAHDISLLCSNYTGISKQKYYYLIISNHELLDEQVKIQKIKKHLKDHNLKKIGEAYKAHFWDSGNKLKICIIGDCRVGKSSLINTWLGHNGFFDDYVGATFSSLSKKTIEVDGNSFAAEIMCELNLVPTYEDKVDKAHLFKESDCTIFVYNVADRNSFDTIQGNIEYVQSIWRQLRIGERQKKYGILVGNKCDLQKRREVSIVEGSALANTYGNITFLEASAMDCINVDAIFLESARKHMYYRLATETSFFVNNSGNCCAIL